MEIYVREYSWMWSKLGLSLAECRVYAYIYGLTNSGKGKTKGYQGSVRALASVLGLNDGGVSRILRTLQDKQLITKTGDVYKSAESISVSAESISVSADTISVSADTISVSADSVNSPVPPIYINKKEREIENIAREETRDAPLSPEEDFFLVTLAAFGLQAGARNVTPKQEKAAKVAWQNYTEDQQRMLLEAVRSGYNVKGNFQFTVEDYLREHGAAAIEGEPTDYNGSDSVPDVPMATACYKGKWGLYTQADIEKYNLETKKQCKSYSTNSIR